MPDIEICRIPTNLGYSIVLYAGDGDPNHDNIGDARAHRNITLELDADGWEQLYILIPNDAAVMPFFHRQARLIVREGVRVEP